MIIYNKDDIKVSTIEEGDKEKVLKYFSDNFNYSYNDSYSLKPKDNEFVKIMDDIIDGTDAEENILVLKKNDEVIGYEAMHVEFNRLIVGHIVVDKEERNKGYGKLLTILAILIAENEDRDVSLHCENENSYLRKLNMKTYDGIHYLYQRQGIKVDNLPKLFVSIDEYRDRVEKRMEDNLEKFKKTINMMKKMDLLH